MLTVAALGSGQAGYYLSLTAASYYAEAPEPEGLWYGLGAREFGLQGAVDADDLTKLCEGYDPRDPARHVRNAGVNEGERARKHGDDLCFSAPKSVSVAWALATPEMREAIEKAMHRAVKDALDYVQDHCGWSRVGAQGQELARVPLTFALFEHSSSRLGDPQLHVHAVCPNLTLRTNDKGRERVTAIDSTNFYHHMMAGGALFRAGLAEGMRGLGFAVERDGTAFRLKGIDENLCERFSQRRAEIVEGILKAAKFEGDRDALDTREVLRAASGRTAELVNLSTRKGKKEYTREELFPVWREFARSLGMDEHYVMRLVNEPRTLAPEQKHGAKEELFRDGLGKLTEEFSHFAEKDLTRKLAEEAQGKGLNARDVRELIENKITGNDVIRLGELITGQKNEGRKSYRERSEIRYTTEQILLMEGGMLDSVGRMAQKSAPIPTTIADAAIERASSKLARDGHKLFPEQEAAVRLLTSGEGNIACMTGKAGTGKSTTLESCRFAWELAGRTVVGCAIQGKTADELQATAGIESRTLASTLFSIEKGWLKLSPKHVVVLDEAGMVPTTTMAKLIDQVEKSGAKLVLAGDAAQLQAIGAGGPFKSISERLGDAFHCTLTKIIRQREQWRRDTVEQFSRGEAKEALIAYAAKGQLHVTKTRDDAVSALVDQWKADKGVENPKDVLLLASLNAEAKAINRACQEERRKAGKLGEAKTFVNNEWLHEHDRVMLCKNSRPLGVKNGFTGEVVGINHLTGSLRVKLDRDGREVVVSPEEYGAKNIKLGYASSVHKSQGRTVEHCHVLMGGHMSDLHLGYVQASRSRESTHLYIDQANAGPDLKDAIRSLSRARFKDLARDVVDKAQRVADHQQARLGLTQGRGPSLGM